MNQAKNKKWRHELKYYINYYEYEILRKRVKGILKLDKNSVDEKGYLIRSLYFDNMVDNDLYEKNYGILKRKKFRVRIYNYQDHIIKLEKKSRYGEYISKESVSITRAEYDQLLNWEFDFLKEKNSEVANDFYLYLRSEHMSPRVIVDYEREAYIGNVSDVRITFDKGLRSGTNSFDIFNPFLVTAETLPTELLVLEVKFNQFLPDYIWSLLQLDRHHRAAISKYVICRENSMVYYKL